MEPRIVAGPPAGRGPEPYADACRAARAAAARFAGRATLIPALEASGLLGRGGAGFPVGRKWRSVAGQPAAAPVVLANGAEGEPLSAKDRTLLRLRPHLVLDGALLAADAVGADRIALYVGSEHRDARAAIRRAALARAAATSGVADRPPRRARHLRRRRGVGGRPLRERRRRATDDHPAAAVRARDRRPPDARPERREPRPCRADRPVRRRAGTASAAGDATPGTRARHGQRRRTATGSARSSSGRRSASSPSEPAPAPAPTTARPSCSAATSAAGSRPSAAGTCRSTRSPCATRARAFGAGVVAFLGNDAAASGRRPGSSTMAGQSAAQCGPCVFGLRAIADATGAPRRRTAASATTSSGSSAGRASSPGAAPAAIRTAPSASC